MPAHVFQCLRYLQVGDSMDGASAERLFHDMANLPNIEFVQLSVLDCIVDFHGPEGCKVDYTVNAFFDDEDLDNTMLEVPKGMTKHLHCLRLQDDFVNLDHWGNLGSYHVKNVDLGKLSNCGVLETIHLDFPSSDQLQAHIYGLGELPHSVTSIFVDLSCVDTENPHLWDLAAGWQTAFREVHGEPHLVISRMVI